MRVYELHLTGGKKGSVIPDFEAGIDSLSKPRNWFCESGPLSCLGQCFIIRGKKDGAGLGLKEPSRTNTKEPRA